MEVFLPKEYSEAFETLKPTIDQYHLDNITVGNLVRTGIELEEQTVQPVSRLWRSADGVAYSVKPSNIKVRLEFVLSNILGIKNIFEQRDVWLVLAALQLVANLFASSVIEIDEISALAVVSIYRLTHADAERAFNYAKDIIPSDPGIDRDNFDKTDFEKSLRLLENLGCITFENGEYFLNEMVLKSMVNAVVS